ncbi:hypothetical protein CR513_53215, partial [Mucuna pruriens]
MESPKTIIVWKEVVAIVLDCMDLDLAFRVEKSILTLDNLQEKRFRTLFLRVKDRENIKEYIMEMSNLAAKFKSLKLELGKDLIVHLILITLLAHFGQFKVSYNTQKDKWSLNELISHCVQEKERILLYLCPVRLPSTATIRCRPPLSTTTADCHRPPPTAIVRHRLPPFVVIYRQPPPSPVDRRRLLPPAANHL